MEHDVFISYSSKDKNTADAICHTLENHKIRCWMAPRDILAGEKYGAVITQAIEACKMCVFVFSERSKMSAWCESELNVAFSGRKPIIPFKIDEAQLDGEMKLMLNNRHWIEAFPSPEESFEQLIKSVQCLLGVCSESKNKDQQDDAKEVFINLAVGLSDIYSLAQQINKNFPHIEKGSEIGSMSMALDNELKQLTTDLITCLESIKDILLKIQSSQYLYKVYTSKLEAINSQCQRINLASGIMFNMNSIYDLVEIINHAISRLKPMTLSVYIESRLTTNIADTDTIGLPYDNASVRSLFFLGGIILSNVTNNERFEVINWGAAIIHDLYCSIPNNEDLNIVAQQMEYEVFYDNSEVCNYVSHNLIYALESVDKIGDLYYLKAK